MLLPPSSISAPIEAVRRVHDKQFHRWPPHINLLYPFLSTPSEQSTQDETSSPELKRDIRMRVEKAVQNINSFRIFLGSNPPGVFHHSKKSKTVWLCPTTHLVQELQAALQAEFSEVDSDRRPFTPHLSVGQAHSQDGAGTLSAEITKSVSEFIAQDTNKDNAPIELEWHVDRVYVIERKGFNDRFKIIGSIDLGKE